jgi:hypothetical protein
VKKLPSIYVNFHLEKTKKPVYGLQISSIFSQRSAKTRLMSSILSIMLNRMETLSEMWLLNVNVVVIEQMSRLSVTTKKLPL